MAKINKGLVLLALFIGALGSYFIGVIKSAMLFVMLGVLLELVFWFKLFRRP